MLVYQRVSVHWERYKNLNLRYFFGGMAPTITTIWGDQAAIGDLVAMEIAQNNWKQSHGILDEGLKRYPQKFTH